jgi:putative FmdB family regulatory protein
VFGGLGTKASSSNNFDEALIALRGRGSIDSPLKGHIPGTDASAASNLTSRTVRLSRNPPLTRNADVPRMTMPIYAYKCSECGFEKDLIQKFSDAPLTVCLECNADAFARQLTAPVFQLKGTGWYVTDFRDSGHKKAAEKSSEDGPAAGADQSSDNASESVAAKGATKKSEKGTDGAAATGTGKSGSDSSPESGGKSGTRSAAESGALPGGSGAGHSGASSSPAGAKGSSALAAAS